MRNELSLFDNDFFDYIFRPNMNKEMYQLRTNIKKEENGYTLEVEMPGFSKEEVKISYEKGYLTIQAEKEEKKEEKYIVCERYSGKVSRSYYVGNIDEAEITANFNNGILSVFVPKEKQEKKYISIQ